MVLKELVEMFELVVPFASYFDFDLNNLDRAEHNLELQQLLRL